MRNAFKKCRQHRNYKELEAVSFSSLIKPFYSNGHSWAQSVARLANIPFRPSSEKRSSIASRKSSKRGNEDAFLIDELLRSQIGISNF